MATQLPPHPKPIGVPGPPRPGACPQSIGSLPPSAGPTPCKHRPLCLVPPRLTVPGSYAMYRQLLPLMVPWAISPWGECGPGGCSAGLLSLARPAFAFGGPRGYRPLGGVGAGGLLGDAVLGAGVRGGEPPPRPAL